MDKNHLFWVALLIEANEGAVDVVRM